MFMRMIAVAAFSALALAGAASAQDAAVPVSYRGHKLVSVDVKGPKDLMQLEQMGVSMACVPAPGQDQRYVLPPDAVRVLDDLHISYRVLSDDVQSLIDQEKTENEAAKANRDQSWFTAYHTLPEIDAYMTQLAALNPAIATRVTVGNSLEGRPIWAMRIQGPNAANNKAFIIICNQHAREWVSPAVGLWTMDRLITQYGVDSGVTALVNNVNWYIVATCNPDGYQYTISTDRLWRKNRRANAGGSFGVDINRNWSIGWSAPEGGNSTLGSDETYRGTAAFSEPETAALRDWIATIPNKGAFMDLHSYSQLVLAPWGYTVALPPRQPEFNYITPDITNAVTNTFGVPYVGGPTATTIYIAAGTSSDWAYGVHNIYGYGMELRDTGTNGFTLPASQIIPNAQEVFNGLTVLANYLNVSFKVKVPTPPTLLSSSASTAVGVEAVAFNNSTIASGGANLYYRVGNSGPFTAVPLTGTAPSLTGVIPAAPCGQQVQYYAEVLPSGSLTPVRDPATAPAAVYSATSQNINVVANDDFQTANAGWVVNLDNTDTATTGRWNRMAPQQTNYQPGADHTPGVGTICWVTDGNAGTGDGSFDIDNGKTTLYSPVFDLSTNTTAKVGYWRWYDRATGSTDTFLVDVSNGGPWVNVETLGSTTNCPDCVGGWIYHEFQVSNFVTPTSTVRFRWVAQDQGTGQVVEAALDDFSVIATAPCAPPPCSGDINGDNAVNTADLTILLGNFGASVPPNTSGDFNGDGVVNTTDLTTLLGRFGATCP